MANPLLATKLHMPPPRPDLVSRPRLMRRLEEGVRRKLTLISAAAGSGKTTLLSEWLHGGAEMHTPPLQAAWLSLDEGDNDPVRFLAYLVAALQAFQPGFGESIRVALQSPQPPPQEALLTALLNEWLEHQRDTPRDYRRVLVLDDYHVLRASPVHQAVSFLLDHLPPPPEGWHLVVASRSDPPLPLARLRGRAQLTELRAGDLRFSPDEAAVFLNEAMGLTLPADQVAALEARTEGWIAGLQLAALSLQGRTTEQAWQFVESFTGSDRFVLDYLVDEVLSREPQPVRAFLLRTSLLERLCAPLCDALLTVEGQPTSQEAREPNTLGAALPPGSPPSPSQDLLEYLEAHNLFIVPLDNERRWYRYHRLLADLLRSRLDHREASELYRQACNWCEAHGLMHEAVHYALASGDLGRAADLVEAHALPMLMRGELTTLLQWLAALPQGAFDTRPWLCVYHAWALVLTGQVEAVEARLQAAERALAVHALPSAPELMGHAAAIRAYEAAMAGDLPTATGQAQQALELLPADETTVRSVMALTLGGVHLQSGNLAGADDAFAEAARLGLRGGNIHVAVPALCNLAELDAQRGHLSRAADTFREATRLAASSSGSPLPVAGQAYAGLCELLYEWNDLENAERHLARSVELGRLWGNTEVLANDCAFLAWAALKQGNQERSRDCLFEAERLVRERAVSPTTAARVAAHRARLHLAQGETAAALRWAQALQQTADDVPGYASEFERLTLARVLIAGQEWEAATRLLTRLRQAAEDTGRTGRAIEALALLALSLQGQGQGAEALAALEQALFLAEPEGYIRSFVDAGEPMADLLRQAAARSIAPAYVARLLAAFDAETAPEEAQPPGTKEKPVAPAGRLAALVEPLTERELEVMRLVAAGLSNQEIADRLVITLGTVKSHTNSIYGKLGVRSRTQAVARAGALGLTQE